MPAVSGMGQIWSLVVATAQVIKTNLKIPLFFLTDKCVPVSAMYGIPMGT